MTHRISRIAIATVFGIGLLVLTGWQFHLSILKSGLVGASTMKVNTALCLLLCSLTLLLIERSKSSFRRRSIRMGAMLLVLVVALVGITTLLQYLLNWNAGIDELLFRDYSPPSHTAYPGRMGLNTAVCLILLSFSLGCLLLETNRSVWVAQFLACGVGLIALLSLLGYLFGVSYFYGSTARTTAMAAPTAIALLLLSLSICLTFPERGWVRELNSPLAGGRMARHALTLAILYPLTFAWIVMRVEQDWMLDPSWPALQILTLMGGIGVVIWNNARALNQAESTLRTTQANLEQRILERTSDLMEMNDQLRASYAEMHALFAAMDDLVLIRDRDGYCLKILTPRSRVLYQPAEDIEGKTPYDTFPPAIAARIQAAIRQALTLEQTVNVEYSLPFPQQTLWLDAKISPIDDRSVIMVVRDVTDRKRDESILQQQTERIQQLNVSLEQQVQERTSKLQTLLQYEGILKRITARVRDSLNEAHILQTAVEELAVQLQLECCNAGIYDLEKGTVAVLYEHLRSPDYSSHKSDQTPFEDFEDICQVLLTGQTVHCCSWLPNVHQAVTLLCCPLMDDQGVLGDLWLFRAQEQVFNDLEIGLAKHIAIQCAIAIRQSRLYQAATSQVQELERLSHLKDDFLSAVSHELRTPMANIRMATQMLEIMLSQDGILNEGATGQYFQILQDECHRETTLINDLLDLSRLDAKVEPLLLNTMELPMWIMHIAEPFLHRTQQQHQTLTFDFAESIPPLTTDFSYLERILTELLHNACKYTPPGETIFLETQPIVATPYANRAPVLSHIRLRLTNTGIAIPPEECDRIFDKFYRIPNNDPWKHGGTGLGLALVKKLTERLNGKIWAESGDRQTTFILELPLTLVGYSLDPQNTGNLISSAPMG